MSDNDITRRWMMKAGALTSGALALGMTGSAAAQTGTQTQEGDAEFRSAIMLADEFNAGAVFRVSSPALENAPVVDNEDAVADYSVRVVEYFNTNEENYLFVPPDAEVQQGDLYVFDDASAVTPVNPADGAGAFSELVQVQYRPLGRENFPFDLEEANALEIAEEGGGEAAVRPSDFYSGALFQITSGPQGWVPNDVDESGFFTDYNTVHAEYLGTDEQFLFFPQEDAQVEPGRLYIMRDEFELFAPEGNLLASEFSLVNEGTVTVDDEFL